MLAVSVDLGSFKVAGKTPSLTLSLSTSMTIALPPLWLEAPTAKELCRASATGTVWISKAGSCQIEMSTLINGQVPDTASFDPTIIAAMTSFLPDCPVSNVLPTSGISLTSQVWKLTGLELRTKHAACAQPDQGSARVSYFLHHPDLSSEMIAPLEVPSAQFQGLKCEVDYSFKPARTKASSKAQATQQASTEPLNLVPQAQPSHSYNLRSNPKRSKKATVAQEEISDAVPGSTSISYPHPEPSHGNGEQEDTESLVSEAIGDMARLLDFAFRKLIGVRRSFPGARTIKRMTSPSLIDVAPAVWDLGYLQVRAHVQPWLNIADWRHRRCLSMRKSSHRSLPESLG
jgi:hypothetical protein